MSNFYRYKDYGLRLGSKKQLHIRGVRMFTARYFELDQLQHRPLSASCIDNSKFHVADLVQDCSSAIQVVFIATALYLAIITFNTYARICVSSMIMIIKTIYTFYHFENFRNCKSKACEALKCFSKRKSSKNITDSQ